ncbi:hypothetical protein [Paraburkholderia adhaesiva]|uniref:hypothetical protein n=1 Tax=Paraburkholderia adhaesiva TaxID=2883244 RepID=UPI001F26C3A2|nr:hypothetical protein [Paraburkholderia adhaesiva]
MMNARTPQPQHAPVFEVHFLSEEVDTVMFGKVTVSELPGRLLQTIMADAPPNGTDEVSGLRFAYRLLCETVRGAHGERLTPEVLESIPTRGQSDIAALMKVSARLNGLNKADVEKA